MAFKSLLDPNFNYRNAASTDIRQTFDRIRREQREQRRRAEREAAEALAALGARAELEVNREAQR